MKYKPDHTRHIEVGVRARSSLLFSRFHNAPGKTHAIFAQFPLTCTMDPCIIFTVSIYVLECPCTSFTVLTIPFWRIHVPGQMDQLRRHTEDATAVNRNEVCLYNLALDGLWPTYKSSPFLTRLSSVYPATAESTIIIMTNPNPYTVSYFNTNDGRRQMSTFPDSTAKESFISYLESIDAVVYSDWYMLVTDSAVDDSISRTADLGGTTYNLPVRS
ncbi:hypothetical protein F5J12DRAFT_296225 [Pisolithus orientalis]|uniref:uncharacterized protein n=1 Tax=Pisolithus orientalis TaxID=936130 RepID=UPI002224F76B|nr:uncharacterized protein F5J12DRAFT_296225 [Pisolithus orientalis]KAI6030526.1 hypothetical protein F5J12DRAFT_296225 [Pisolithus orientalis]